MSDSPSSLGRPVQDAPAAFPAGAGSDLQGARVPVDPTADEVHVLDLIKVLYKRRWAAATVFLIVFVAAVVHAFTATPIFEARTRLLIESGDPNVVSFTEVVEAGQASADYYQTQYGILQSRGLARRTIEALDLWRSPLFGGDAPAGEGQEAGADETSQQTRVIDAFSSNVAIEPIRNSRLVDIKFRSTDPAMATLVANELAKSYIGQTLEYKYTTSQEASDWLAERLAEQRQQVEAAEAALQEYREQNDAISLEDRENIVVQKLADLNAAVTKAKTERIQKEAIERQLRAADQDQAKLDTFPAILGNAFIQRQKAELADLQRKQAQLADKLGARHPEMLEMDAAIQNAQLKLRTEIAKVVQSVRTEYQAALAQERSLVAALDQQKAEALAMNRKSIEYSVLARDVESGKQLYESLLQRAKETGVAGELRTSNIRIVDEAERPQSPVSPNVRLNLMLGVFGGLFFAVAVAFLFEYADSRLKSPEELRAALGLSSFGMIPELGTRWTATAPLLTAGVPPNFSETMRAVRTNVLFSWPEGVPRTLVVTSTGPGEGKTLVASNLAIGFALAGHRVLLVDADLRRPCTHELFNLDREPGLSNVLVGHTKVSDAVRQTGIAGLWALTAGRLPPNPLELLNSKRFEDLVHSLGQHFDTVIIDTPPVMVVADPAVVASLASGVLFVVGAEMTSRHTARAALEQLQRGRARILGAVLNRVQIDKNGYYYRRYYRAEYAAYYHTAS